MMTSLDPGGVGGYHLDHKCNRWQRFIDRNRDQRGRLLGLDPGVHHRNCKSYFFKDYFPCTDHCAGKGNKKRGSVGIRMRIILFLGHPVWCFNHIRADNISHYDNSCRSYHLRGTCHNADSFQGAYRRWGWNIDKSKTWNWLTKQLVVLECNLPKTQATEDQIEEAGGRPRKPETGGVLTGYKKVTIIVDVPEWRIDTFTFEWLTSTRQPRCANLLFSKFYGQFV